MNNKTFTWLAAAGIGLVLAASYLLDFPSEQELAEAVALDVKDAQAQAARSAGRSTKQVAQMAKAACDRIHGDRALVMSLDDGTGFVCRRV